MFDQAIMIGRLSDEKKKLEAEVERLKAENGKLRSELEQSDLKTWLEADKQRDCEDN